MKKYSDIAAKYANLQKGNFPPSLDKDFARVIKSAPQQHLEECLAEAFRSSETPPFSEELAKLYKRSRKRHRAKLLTIMVSHAPKLLQLGLSERIPSVSRVKSGLPSIQPRDTDNLLPRELSRIVSTDESLQPVLVEAVSHYYSGARSALLKMDRPMRGHILANLATADTMPSNIEPAVVVTEMSGEKSGNVALTTEAAPPPRYASIQIFHENDGGIQGAELRTEQPLRVKKYYIVEVSVRLKPRGVPPATSRRPIRDPMQIFPVDIIVTAESDDFLIPQPVSKLVLPPKGDSTEQAIFRVMPLRKSVTGQDFLKIRFRLFYRFNLFEVLTLRAETVSSLEDDGASAFGHIPAVDLNYEPLRQSDLNDFDLTTPCRLHIYVEPKDQQYVLTFTLDRQIKDELAFVAPIPLTSSQLEETIAGVRKSLLKISSSDTLGTQVDGNLAEHKVHFSQLLDSGSKLWTLLFGRGNNQAISIVGMWLKHNPLPVGSKIQISIEEGAATFTFAWGLLYDLYPNTEFDPEALGFWGMRYVIEQKMAGVTRLPGEELTASTELEIGTMYWQFSQTPNQQKYLKQLQNQAKNVKLALGRPIDALSDAQDCLTNGKCKILYFFTHGHTKLPNGENYGATIDDFLKIYESLPQNSPTRKDWAITYENIKKKKFTSDESWIELSYGRLELAALYRDIKELPARPLVILNMCDSAQVTPSLSQSFIDFFLTRGATAVIGTECSMRPVFADFIGCELLKALFCAEPVGKALLRIRIEAARRNNLLGLAYTLFGASDAVFQPPLISPSHRLLDSL